MDARRPVKPQEHGSLPALHPIYYERTIMKIKLDGEQVDYVILKGLIEFHDHMRADATMSKAGRQSYELENRKDARRIRKDLRRVIKLYTTKSEYEGLGLEATD